MKLGLILECGPGGPDEQVFSHLARRVLPKVKLRCETMNQKPKLISGCGKVAAQLLADSFDRIGIIWDLFPRWRIPGEHHCLGQDRDDIFASLKEAKVPLEKVELVCVQEELEALCLADNRALTTFFSRAQHPAKKIPEFKKPETISNPKGQLRKLFSRFFGKTRRYNEMVEPLRIIRACPDWERLKRCPSFVRFIERVLGCKA